MWYRWFEAELHRLRGEVVLRSAPIDVADAEPCFQQALGIARQQGARWWELRATTSLAKLCVDQGRRREAGDLLASIHGWFTDGFDTPDLQAASRLLEALRAPEPGTRIERAD